MPSEDNESAQCPYCGSDSECEHLLLCADTTFRRASSGALFEAFDEKWGSILRAHEDDAHFDERTAFEGLLEIVDTLANASHEFVIEGGPGMTSAYLAFYVATNRKMRSACKQFSLRNKPVFQVAWADDEIVLELSLSDRNWTKLTRGERVSVRGKGYCHEGEFFWDYWDFIGGTDGELVVRYGSPKDGDYSARGFAGKTFGAVK